MKYLSKKTKGFTLVELMIVVAIIGILAAIAIPKFANLIIKSKEGATKGNLGALRSAVAIYYGDNEGIYPASIDNSAFVGTTVYIDEIPLTKLDGHTDTSAVRVAATVDETAAAGWWYTSGTSGKVRVNCTHNDHTPAALKISTW